MASKDSREHKKETGGKAAEVEKPKASAGNFIRSHIDEDRAKGKNRGAVVTRFPPEPNGYLHIGHAKAICLNFGIAADYGGSCHLRFDDTNPVNEDAVYAEAIQKDIRWLGFDWGQNLFHASDYFEKLHGFAVDLIERGKAYVCSLNEEKIRQYRGTVTESGKASPYRNRSVAENLALFEAMRAGEYEDGAHVLRAKIHMASPNMKMRDPLLYRIRHVTHHRTGKLWCIYPMYDFAHCLSDAIEGITHSLCTLEFENNRELYDWILDQLETACHPQQIEFARLNLNYTVMSKRKLLEMVESGRVSGWDDPRMPTLAGMRRRGYTPEAIRGFCERIGVAKANSVVDLAQLEHSVRDDLNHRVPRVMCVFRPLKIVIENWPQGRVENLDAPLYPHDIPKQGSRPLPFSGTIFIEKDDFLDNPPKNYYRLAPGREVRLRHAYIIKCERVIREPDSGEVLELRCSYDPDSKGVVPKDRKVKGTIHWVSARHAVPAEIRCYDRLISVENPKGDFLESLNPQSLEKVQGYVEPAVAQDPAGSAYQFERQGYFCSDSADSAPGKPVYNRTVPLKDSWSKLTAKAAPPKPKNKAKKKAAPPKPQKRIPIPRDPKLAEQFHGFVDRLGLSPEDAEVLVSTAGLGDFFLAALAEHDEPKAVANWIANDLRHVLKDRSLGDLPFAGRQLGALVALIHKGTISNTIAKDVFGEMLKSGISPAEIVAQKGLEKVTDGAALASAIEGVLRAHPDEVDRFRAGQKKLLGFFVGQVMKATGGKADPKLLQQLLRQKLFS